MSETLINIGLFELVFFGGLELIWIVFCLLQEKRKPTSMGRINLEAFMVHTMEYKARGINKDD